MYFSYVFCSLRQFRFTFTSGVINIFSNCKAYHQNFNDSFKLQYLFDTEHFRIWNELLHFTISKQWYGILHDYTKIKTLQFSSWIKTQLILVFSDFLRKNSDFVHSWWKTALARNIGITDFKNRFFLILSFKTCFTWIASFLRPYCSFWFL